MNNDHDLIIAGAGPVGLGAALFLARQGRIPRIVEMRDAPSTQSKALAVNPRTLTILKPTGITDRMLELGKRIVGGHFHRGEKLVAALDFSGIHPDYSFLLALSQATTERLLSDAFIAAGGHVQRGTKMTACRNTADGVEISLASSPSLEAETTRCKTLLAADGARSLARQQLNVDFIGSSFSEPWHLADAPLKTTLADDRAHIIFLPHGAFLFLIRVVDPMLADSPGGPIWRIVSNRPDPLSQLVCAEPSGPAVWTSSFHVAHRVNAFMSVGNVYFAGDAAHVHSPVGARGMNLGLEDAWMFSELLRANRLADYNRLRQPVDHAVVRRVELISKMASGESTTYRVLRRLMFSLGVTLPFVRSRMLATIAGLDHDLQVIS